MLKKDKNLLKLQFSEIDQGALNLIKSIIWQDNATQIAGFHIEHPEVGKPVFTLKTKNKEAKKVWNDALDKLGSQFNKIKNNIKF